MVILVNNYYSFFMIYILGGIMKAKLILENGMIFHGEAFGYLEETVGELVFTTVMTGYQEVLTDPSYHGQIVVMTYPLIGNYGINLEDMQSDRVRVKGFIIKEDAKLPNNFRCEITLEAYLKQNKVMGLKNIDTRHLTRIIRDTGTKKAVITTRDLSQEELGNIFFSFSNSDAVKQVTRKDILKIEGSKEKIAIIDFGIKKHIIESFAKRNCDIRVFPAYTDYETIMEYNPDALFLSNGPGDPEDLPEAIELVKKVIGKKTVIGICLGHQIAALAMGGKTAKMRFGHRGGNHPVKDIEKNKIYISSQNHGYKVTELPEGTVLSHVNLNDNSIEGMKNKELKVYTVQFHPEASPGPEETAYIFDDFLNMIREG